MVTGSRIWHMTHPTGLLRFVSVMTFFGDMMKSNNLYPFLQPIVGFRTLSRRIGWFSGMVRRHMWWFLNKMKGFCHLKRHIYLDKTGYHSDQHLLNSQPKHLPGTLPRNQLPASHHRGACLLGCPSLAVLNCTERWLEGTVPWLSRSHPQGFSRLMGCILNGHFCMRKSIILYIDFRISLPSGEPCLILDPNLILETAQRSLWPDFWRHFLYLEAPPPSQGRHEQCRSGSSGHHALATFGGAAFGGNATQQFVTRVAWCYPTAGGFGLAGKLFLEGRQALEVSWQVWIVIVSHSFDHKCYSINIILTGIVGTVVNPTVVEIESVVWIPIWGHS